MYYNSDALSPNRTTASEHLQKRQAHFDLAQLLVICRKYTPGKIYNRLQNRALFKATQCVASTLCAPPGLKSWPQDDTQ